MWICVEGSDNKLTIGLVPNASYESNQIYPGQVKITDGKFDTVKGIRLRKVFLLAIRIPALWLAIRSEHWLAEPSKLMKVSMICVIKKFHLHKRWAKFWKFVFFRNRPCRDAFEKEWCYSAIRIFCISSDDLWWIMTV